VTTTTTVPQPSSTTLTGTTTTSTTTVLVPTGTIPTFLEQCAPGSTLDPTSGNCVIFYEGQTIFVSKPFKGPTGGTVVPLAAARAKFKSPCLSGAGPDYVLLVTARRARAKGTPLSDRILGLNTGQLIYGLAGNDCIDELKANGKIVDGNGRDRLYVTSGVNRVIGGNGPNIIHGGNGRNWITDGTGDDYIYGGSLHNRIDAYGNEKHIYGGKSNDRIWTNSIDAFVSCGGGNRNTLFGRQKIIAYGKKHGCQSLHHLS
jgi:Ca2+-binding RTX toxin-like protein